MVQAVSSAISALQTLGNKMRITANNVANSTTSGFKRSRASSVNVVNGGEGAGTRLGEISGNLSQGAAVATGSPTDLAISGEGYFIVSAPDGGTYYTRDGDFDFDNEGRLVDTSGNVVQGWRMNPENGEISGGMGDIALDDFSAPPRATNTLTALVNLDSGSQNNSAGVNALSAAWDGSAAGGNPLPSNAYEYSTTTTVFDSRGGRHDVTLYFDRSENTNEWEYIVTTDPGDDNRTGASGGDLGLLARGTLTFDSTGTLTDMEMSLNDGAGNWTDLDPDSDIAGGHFAFQADFLGDGGGASVMDVELDFGARYNGSFWVVGAGSSIQYASASSTMQVSSDGNGPGNLMSVSVGDDGVVTGSYSNGTSADLFQVATARFNNPQGLDKIGNNLYSATDASGVALTGTPGSNGLGRIIPQSLEGSNVDLAEEMVNMTIFQRSYQANLKVIQVADEMKGDVLDIIS
jgi:flagellar hook protein FlgE